MTRYHWRNGELRPRMSALSLTEAAAVMRFRLWQQALTKRLWLADRIREREQAPRLPPDWVHVGGVFVPSHWAAIAGLPYQNRSRWARSSS
jgi:hypothetical protein